MSAPRRVIFGCAGPRLDPAEARFFAQAQPWGFILFARNVVDPVQLRARAGGGRAGGGGAGAGG
ncbi:MAG: beta-hexosaminidase, partial [Rhodobacteraceae bacterium]|nr:beta-hexosaminidase [Paracoccaceae bacterium]